MSFAFFSIITVIKMPLKCDEGYISRKAHTRKRGDKIINIKENCIKATSLYGKKAEEVTKPIIAKMLENQKRAEKMTDGPKKCPEGTIRRTAYISNRNGKEIVVPSKCIKERGKNDGKAGLYDKNTGERIYIYMEPGTLGRFGYRGIKELTEKQRHIALDKAYVGLEKNWLTIFRKLNYLATLNKNNPLMYGIYKGDSEYIKNKYSTKR